MADNLIIILASVVFVAGLLDIIIPLIQLVFKIAPYIIRLYL